MTDLIRRLRANADTPLIRRAADELEHYVRGWLEANQTIDRLRAELDAMYRDHPESGGCYSVPVYRERDRLRTALWRIGRLHAREDVRVAVDIAREALSASSSQKQESRTLP